MVNRPPNGQISMCRFSRSVTPRSRSAARTRGSALVAPVALMIWPARAGELARPAPGSSCPPRQRRTRPPGHGALGFVPDRDASPTFERVARGPVEDLLLVRLDQLDRDEELSRAEPTSLTDGIDDGLELRRAQGIERVGGLLRYGGIGRSGDIGHRALDRIHDNGGYKRRREGAVADHTAYAILNSAHGDHGLATESISLAREVITVAQERGVPLRALGGVAIEMRAPDRVEALRRSYGDLDCCSLLSRRRDVEQLMREAGLVGVERFNKIQGAARQIWWTDDRRTHIDVFLGEFVEPRHRLLFDGRLRRAPRDAGRGSAADEAPGRRAQPQGRESHAVRRCSRPTNSTGMMRRARSTATI